MTDQPAPAGLSVEEIECVSYETGFKEAAPSVWRIEVGGYCTDFETKQAAENFAGAVNALITKQRDKVVEGLKEARDQFLFYEGQHRAKATHEADGKAEVNRRLAERMEAFIEGTWTTLASIEGEGHE